MTKTVAELRANKPTGRPLRTMSVCLKPELMAEVQALTAEHDRLLALVPAPVDEDGDEKDGPPGRMGGESPEAKRERADAEAQVSEIRDRLAALLDEMAEYEGEMTLRANLSDGEWRRWLNAHPARSEGEPGHERDDRVTVGFCNADALIDDLGTFVHQWNGEHITATDWAEVFEPAIGTADKATMATRIVELYESRLDFPRLRSGLSSSLKRLNDSDSRATSASPTSGSTAGSPDRSSEATTPPDAA